MPSAWKRSDVSQANESWASSSAGDRRHAEALAVAERAEPLPAHQRMPSAGADATPTIISPDRSRPISVAQIGTPRT